MRLRLQERVRSRQRVGLVCRTRLIGRLGFRGRRCSRLQARRVHQWPSRAQVQRALRMRRQCARSARPVAIRRGDLREAARVRSGRSVMLGSSDIENPIYKWDKWEKIDKKVEFPDILRNLKKKYEWINCEFIGGHLIEVQFRRNPNFRYDNTVAIPVWNEDMSEFYEDYRYIEDIGCNRRGFWVK